jgi:DNA primase small subunit
MNQKSFSFVRSLFGEFYRQYYLPDVPSKMDRREFGFNMFEGFMLRHKSFSSPEELKSFLEIFIPTDAYYSCAYYEDPTAEMDRKGWIGADLIFDVDADHILTGCDKVHDEWICEKCGFAGKGITPEKCPICNSEKFSVTTWPCEICLESAKVETIKLLDILMNDFGFSASEIQVFFSGHRGYHVQIENEAILDLDANARKEIVDYMTGLGFDLTAQKVAQQVPHGWHDRAVKGVLEFIRNATEEALIKAGLKRNTVKAIMQNKDALIKNWVSGTWHSIRGIGPETIRKLIEQGVKMESAKIDTVVTTDIHRLIRLPGTLHSKTGFKKTRLSASEIEDFNPFKKAIAFHRGTVRLHVSEAPRFRLGNEVFGPYRNQRVELPTSAALLLICKNKAEVLS